MRAIALGLLIAAATGLPAFGAEPDGPANLIDETEAVRIGVQGVLAARPADTDARRAQKDALLDYYAVPAQKLLWVNDKGLTERAKLVIAEIAKADDYGLRASDYKLPEADSFNPSELGAKDWLADAEATLSAAVLDYAKDARGGRLEPVRLSKNLDPTLALPDPSEVLASIAIRSDPGAYLRSFQPDQPQFEALRQKLIELRGGSVAEEATPAVVTIPDGPTLKFGMEHEQVALLRTRLDVPQGENPARYDEVVLAAVRQFQASNGIAADGIVGGGTRRILNGGPRQKPVGAETRIRQILVNMERWRWLPHDLGSFYVTVNIPEFTLRVVEEGTPIHTARVVVGKRHTQTPVIQDEMETIVFNPYWNVPNSIKNEEIAPYFGGGGGFFGGFDTSVLKRHGLRLKYGSRIIDPDTVDWSRHDLRSFDLVQPPGPGNVLGKVKFLFPNSHDVYMHDTTQKHLFNNAVRAESHGCMRVQNPDKLAEILLARDKSWSRSQLDSVWHGPDDNPIALDQKIPVYVTYFTLRVNEDGSFSSFNDLYGHDPRMLAALDGKGYVPDESFGDAAVAGGQWTSPSPVRRYRPGRSSPGADFARSLFGF